MLGYLYNLWNSWWGDNKVIVVEGDFLHIEILDKRQDRTITTNTAIEREITLLDELKEVLRKRRITHGEV